MFSRYTRLIALLMALAPAAAAQAVGVAFWTRDLGGGMFQYNMRVDNDGPENMAGLIVIHAQTDFGLNEDSFVVAPEDWDYFPPQPPLVDELDYFSLDVGADIPVGESLEVFRFQSMRDPDTLQCPPNFALEVIGRSGTPYDPGCPVRIPEPSAGVLMLVGLAMLRRRRAEA
jgi:hypothetical protein